MIDPDLNDLEILALEEAKLGRRLRKAGFFVSMHGSRLRWDAPDPTYPRRKGEPKPTYRNMVFPWPGRVRTFDNITLEHSDAEDPVDVLTASVDFDGALRSTP